MSYAGQTYTDGMVLTAAMMTALDNAAVDTSANTVRHDAAQELTEAQRETARENIGAVSAAVSGTTLVLT